MLTILRWRIFWTCRLFQSGTGYYFHGWRNWVTGENYVVFAGYLRRSLNRKSTTFRVAILQFDEEYDD